MRGRRASWALALGATAVAAASTVALAGNHERPATVPVTVAHLTELERVVARDHLSRGYADYWEAGSAAWSSAGRLVISPVAASGSRLVPMPGIATAAAWYRPIDQIRSFLLLIRGDPYVPDALPSGVPRPRRIVSVGPIRVLEYPFDIARDLG